MGALSPRRRRCSPVLQRDSRVLAAAFFYGLILWHRGTIRFASSVSFCILFLTSQKKYACGATAAASPYQRHSGETGQKGRCPHRSLQTYPKFNLGGLYPQGVCRINGTSGVGRPRAFGSETAKYQWTMLCRCAIIFAKINHKHSLIQRYRKEDQYGGNQGELRR